MEEESSNNNNNNNNNVSKSDVVNNIVQLREEAKEKRIQRNKEKLRIYQLCVDETREWLLKKTGLSALSLLNPWEGFICASDYAKFSRAGIESTRNFTLREQSNISTPLNNFQSTDPSATMLNPVATPVVFSTSNSDISGIKLTNYDQTHMYPISLVAKRWENLSGLQVGYGLMNPLIYEQSEVRDVMHYMVDAIPGTFMYSENKETNETRLFSEHNPNIGAAFLERDHGLLNKAYLSAFAPIRKHHLLNGIIEFPADVVERAELCAAFDNLAEDYPFRSNTGNPIEPIDSDDEQKMDCSDDDPVSQESYFLLPCDGLIAWTIPDNPEDRASKNIHAIQLRVRSRTSEKVVKLYWLINGASLKPLIHSCYYHLISNVLSVKWEDIGVTVYPFKPNKFGVNAWSNILGIDGATKEHIINKDEQDKLLDKSRKIYLKYYINSVVFPKGLHDQSNLCTKLPKDWPEFKEFDQDLTAELNKLSINENKKK